MITVRGNHLTATGNHMPYGIIIIIIIVECWTQEVNPLCPDLQFRDVALLYSRTSLADPSKTFPIVLQTF